MAAIDNLSEINYSFSDTSYFFSREQIEKVFGSPLSELQESEKSSDRAGTICYNLDMKNSSYQDTRRRELLCERSA